jgi:serine/threonine protein phosphatase 1
VRYPAAPEGLTIYVIGDIHGRLDLLLDCQQRIDRDMRQIRAGKAVEVYLGDYIDRGPNPAGVVSRLISRASERDAVFLRGNHEQILLDFLDGGDCLQQWLGLGGASTMLSYGLDAAMLRHSLSEDVRRELNERVPPEHRKFLEATGSYICAGPYLAVHAGIRPGIKLEHQKTDDLLSIRQPFLQHEGDFGFIVVHGHTPVPSPDLRANRINVDTGAFASNCLTCLRIGEDGARILL